MALDVRRRASPSIWDLMERMLEEPWPSMFPLRRGEGWMPETQRLPLNAWETRDNYTVMVLVPGVDPGSLNITAVGGSLTIEGEMQIEPPEGARAFWTEFGTTRFRRTIQLPDAIDPDRVEANYRNGLLEITVPKAEHTRPRTIRVRAGEMAEPRARGAMAGARTAGVTTAEQPTVAAGVEVVGSDGQRIGIVKAVRQNDFLVDRPMQRDVYVPFNALQHVQANQIVLSIPADQVDDQGWETPSMVQTPPPVSGQMGG